VATSAIKGVLPKPVWRDGQSFDVLTCGHELPSLWNALRRKIDTPTRRFCRKCWDAIDPDDRIPSDETLFADDVAKGWP